MGTDIEGEFVEEPDDNAPNKELRRPRDAKAAITGAARWASQHRRGLGICLAAILVLIGLDRLELLGPALGLLPWAWVAFLGICAAIGIIGWIARSENREQARTFARDYWRELAVAGVVSVVIGEVAAADSLAATVLLSAIAFPFVLTGVGALEEQTRFGQTRFAPWLHRRGPRAFALAAALLVLLGPQFYRETPTEVCDPPNYWAENGFQESESGGGSATYGCFDPAASDWVATRSDGRSVFGLRLSNVALRLYSLNFTESRYEGIGVCVEKPDCFP